MLTMSVLFAVLFGIAFSASSKRHQYGLMSRANRINSTTNTSQLGICYPDKLQKWIKDPYVVSIHGNADSAGSICCTGSILSLDPAIILTTAECITFCVGPNAIIRVGCNTPPDCSGYTYTVQDAVIHQDYGSGPLPYSNDIGLVYLNNPITQKHAKTILLPSVQPLSGNIRIVSYGNGGSPVNVPSRIQSASNDLIDAETCNTALVTAAGGGGPFTDDTIICTQDLDTFHPSTACLDFGAPFGKRLCNKQMIQYGIHTNIYVFDCGDPECDCCPTLPIPGTNTFSFKGWINSNVEAWKKGNFNYTL